MQIYKLDTSDRRQVRDFTRFPFALYRNNKLWIPPLAGEMEAILNRQTYPFYQHSEADFFVVKSEGQVLGRIAAIHNRNYCTVHHEKTAFFYHYECVPDAQVSNLLLQTAVDWAKERGLTNLLGGRGLIRSSCAGLLVEGFQHRPSATLLYNPPYYQQFIEAFGFCKETDYYTGELERSHHLSERIYEMAEKLRQRQRFEIVTFRNKSDMLPWLPHMEELHQQAFEHNIGFYPMTHEEFELMARGLLAVADPRFVKLILQEGKIAGFILAYPDISAAIRRTGGRIWPIGWLDLLLEKRRSQDLDVNAVGLLPAYQGQGANILLYTELETVARQHNMQRLRVLQVDERNTRSKADMEKMGVHWIIRHRIFHLSF